MYQSRGRNRKVTAGDYRPIFTAQISSLATGQERGRRTQSRSFGRVSEISTLTVPTFQVLTTIDGRPGWTLDTTQLLADMREIDEEAAGDYLEHVIVVRRSIASVRRILERSWALLSNDLCDTGSQVPRCLRIASARPM